MVEFDYATLEHRLRELAFLNSGVRIVLSDHRGVEPKIEEMRYEGGLRAFVRFLDRTKHPLINEPIVVEKQQQKIIDRGRAVVERQLPRERAVLHQQHPAARRRHASGRLPRGADPHRQHLCRLLRHRQEGEGGADRRRRARRPDLRALGQGAGPQILEPDQGQARLLGGAARGRERHGRRALGMVRGESGRGAQHRAEDRGSRGGARGGAQSPRSDPPQGRARHGFASRQARRLPGARSRQVRAVPGRGRFSRRQRQAGARPRLPGRAPLARQDPQRGTRAHRQDAVEPGDRHADHRARHRHQRRVRSRASCAITRSSS